jgi:purine-nucleoside phosphorylase
MIQAIEASADFLRDRLKTKPRIGMITGTGLGKVTERVDTEFRIPYKEIPHFPRSTVEGHKGTLLSGLLAGTPVLALEGRFHIYEGYSLEEITFPIRVMSKLGITHLFISSAAGGLNPLFQPGDVMVVTDHINLMGRNPLIGPNLDQFGPRFPDMAEVYDPHIIRLAGEEALNGGIDLKQGIYVGITGPSLETPAETRFLRMIGSDAVGMSTVPEVIVGVHCGLRIGVIVAITNVNLPDCMKESTIDDIIATAEMAGGKLSVIWERICSRIAESK